MDFPQHFADILKRNNNSNNTFELVFLLRIISRHLNLAAGGHQLIQVIRTQLVIYEQSPRLVTEY